MTGTILQFVVGGVLLCFLVWLKLRDVLGLLLHFVNPPWLRELFKILAHTVLALIAVVALLDPLIPGVASLTVKLPEEPWSAPTLRENLRVRVVPVGLQDEVGGDRTAYAAFDSDGTARVLSHLALLETSVTIQLFDRTHSSETIKSANVYLSPFVRRQLIGKTITF